MADSVVCGPDADDFVERIGAFVDAGFDHVSLHQVGPNQADFPEFYGEDVPPSFRRDGVGSTFR